MRGRRRRKGGRRRRRGRRLGWQSLTLPLTMLVQACEGFGLASMGTPVVQLTVVFEIYISSQKLLYFSNMINWISFRLLTIFLTT